MFLRSRQWSLNEWTASLIMIGNKSEKKDMIEFSIKCLDPKQTEEMIGCWSNCILSWMKSRQELIKTFFLSNGKVQWQLLQPYILSLHNKLSPGTKRWCQIWKLTEQISEWFFSQPYVSILKVISNMLRYLLENTLPSFSKIFHFDTPEEKGIKTQSNNSKYKIETWSGNWKCAISWNY